MSIITTLDVFCDANDCLTWVDGATGHRATSKEARQQAAREGWTFRDGKDYCPEHTRKGT